MVLFNLGSVADRVLSRFDTLSASTSGSLVSLADEERLFMEQFTGFVIGSVSIEEKYQPALIDLVSARALELTDSSGGDYSTLNLGEFKVEKGSNSNFQSLSKQLRSNAMQKMKVLGRKIKFVRSLG